MDRNNDIIAFAELNKVANEEYDGHFSLLKFTTNWRCALGTGDLSRVGIQRMAVGKTMCEAIWNCLDKRVQTFGKPD